MAAKVLFVVYFFYSILYVPIVQALVSIAIGGIAFGYTESYEIAVIAVLLANFLYPLTQIFRKEGFADSAEVISARIRSLSPQGVVTKMSEGFEDAKKKTGHIDASGSHVDASGNENFETAEPAGLFKLGAIPKDLKSGFHIDAGTTVMNALNSLKPEQLKAMTEDTKQLIDTQKSLMNMLQTFKPMMSEGKQMMDTFQEMFGQQGMPAASS
jgi:hypothetical protein